MDRKPPPRRKRRLLLLALVALMALGAGHALLWRAMANQLEAGWQSWVQLRRAQGWQVAHAPPVRGGWPFSATLTLDRLRLEGAATTVPGGLGFTAQRAVLRVELPWLDRLQVDLPGQQRLRLGPTEYPFTADRLTAILPLERDTPPASAELLAERLRIGTPAGGVEMARASLAVSGSSSATDTEAALALTLSAGGVDLPPAAPGDPLARFGRRIETVSADLALSGPLPGGRAPAPRAEAWRDGGGTLELRTLALRWGPLGGAAAATLAFDDTLQPMGAGTLRLVGAADALDALAEAGLIGRRAALTARGLLPLVSRPSAETGAPEIEVPLTLEDRTLSLARIPVMRIPLLAWPMR
jgi:hypothetical protein